MADDQADASGKYGMNGRGPQGAARFWPSIFKAIELVSEMKKENNCRLNFFVKRCHSTQYSAVQHEVGNPNFDTSFINLERLEHLKCKHRET